jgi:predicted ribosomally synthesized peptide with SipW-like signal peptide
MKAILISLMVIGLVGGMVGGGLFAYFSDTETSTGNTFTAGTIDITVTGGGIVKNGSQVEFKPCEWGYLEYTITNIGENPADVYKHIISLVGSQGTSSEPEVEAEAGTPVVPTAANFNFDLKVGTVDKIPAPGVPLANVISKWMFLGTIDKGQSITVVQSFHLLDTGVPQNELQGDVATIDEEYLALQVPGDVVPPGTIYPLP